MPSHSSEERAALADALTAAGPGAPTLCEGWTTTDLVAHLIVREQRPDAAIGNLLPPGSALRRWTDTVQHGVARRDYARLVSSFRGGPRLPSVFALPGVDVRMNLAEHFVHCEDVRRAADDWKPRDLPEDRQAALWTQITSWSRMLLRRSPVPVTLQTPAGRSKQVAAGTGGSKNAKGSLPGVTLIGEPGELTLYIYGRLEHAQVDVVGPPEALEPFRALSLKF